MPHARFTLIDSRSLQKLKKDKTGSGKVIPAKAVAYGLWVGTAAVVDDKWRHNADTRPALPIYSTLNSSRGPYWMPSTATQDAGDAEELQESAEAALAATSQGI
jgi:hypothetical protein